jgi:hypothetical protein
MKRPPRESPAVWVLLAALTGFVSAAAFSSWLHFGRNAFVAGYVVVAGVFLTSFMVIAGVRPMVQLRRHWRVGVAAGLLLGAFLAHGVVGQPASSRPVGPALVGGLAWLGIVYGAVDALLLSVVPVLTVYGSRSPEALRHGAVRAGRGALALLASLVITGAYHLGFAEFRGAALLQPLIGNAIVTLGYLLTGSPVTALLAHIIMHSAAVLHGMDTTIQLPPHY